MKHLPVALSVAALGFSIAAFVAASRPIPAPIVQSADYLTSAEHQVISSLADRVDAERRERADMDRAFRSMQNGSVPSRGALPEAPAGIQSGPVPTGAFH
jgi:hypothetical protein